MNYAIGTFKDFPLSKLISIFLSTISNLFSIVDFLAVEFVLHERGLSFKRYLVRGSAFDLAYGHGLTPDIGVAVEGHGHLFRVTGSQRPVQRQDVKHL